MTITEHASPAPAAFSIEGLPISRMRATKHLRAVLVEAKLAENGSVFALVIYANKPDCQKAIEAFRNGRSKAEIDTGFATAVCCHAEIDLGSGMTSKTYGNPEALPAGVRQRLRAGCVESVLPSVLDHLSWEAMNCLPTSTTIAVVHGMNREPAVATKAKPKGKAGLKPAPTKETSTRMPEASSVDVKAARSAVAGQFTDGYARSDYRRKAFAAGHPGFVIGLPESLDDARPLIREINELHANLKKEGKLRASEKQSSFMLSIYRATGIPFDFKFEDATPAQASEYISRTKAEFENIRARKARP